MSNEMVSPEFFNKKGSKIAGLPDIPVEFATRFIEFNGLRYERQEDGTYNEVGKAQGVKPKPEETEGE